MEYLDILYSFCSKDSNAMTKLIDSDLKFRELILDISQKPKVGYFLKPDMYNSPDMKLEYINISYENGVPFIVLSYNLYSSIFELHFRKKKAFLKGEYLEAYFVGHSSLVSEYSMSATISKELYNAYKKWLGNDIKVQGYKLGDLANSIYLTMAKIEKDLAYRFANRSSVFKIDGFIEYNDTKFFSFSVETGNNSFYIKPRVVNEQLIISVSSLTGNKYSQDVYYNLTR